MLWGTRGSQPGPDHLCDPLGKKEVEPLLAGTRLHPLHEAAPPHIVRFVGMPFPQGVATEMQIPLKQGKPMESPQEPLRCLYHEGDDTSSSPASLADRLSG